MNINLKSQSWLMIYSYLIANGLLYSLLFWQGFNINILQYVSPYDLLPSLLFIFILPFFLIMIYLVIHGITIPLDEKTDRFFNKRQSKTYKNLKIILNVAIRVFIILYLMNSLFFKSGFDRQVTIVIIIAMIIVYPIHRYTTLFSDKGRLRDLYIGAFLLLPFSLYVTAHYKVKLIKEGFNTYIVSSDSECTKEQRGDFRYISSIGDKAFAYSLSDNSLCVFKYNYLHLKEENRLLNQEIEKLQTGTI